MIEIRVDGASIRPGDFELNQQSEPFPGGSRYRFWTDDRELTAIVRRRYLGASSGPMEPSEVSHIFNLARMFLSMKYEKSRPLFWANTIDRIDFDGDAMALAGVCSPHVA